MTPTLLEKAQAFAALHSAAEHLAQDETFGYPNHVVTDPAMSAFFQNPVKENLGL